MSVPDSGRVRVFCGADETSGREGKRLANEARPLGDAWAEGGGAL